MKGKEFECKKCKAELHFKNIQGIRILRENAEGKLVYNVYCPECKEHFEQALA